MPGGGHIERESSDYVCADCVRDSFLQATIRSEGQLRSCSYCQREGVTVSIETLAEEIGEVVDEFFVVTPDNPNSIESAMHNDRESSYSWERAGEFLVNVIVDIASVGDLVAQDVQKHLEDSHYDHERAEMGDEQEYSSEACYEPISIGCPSWTEKWNGFRSSLLHEARFFNQDAQLFLSELFEGLESLLRGSATPAVVEAGPDTDLTALYRARDIEDHEEVLQVLCRPDERLGPPPKRSAREGRMNPRGVPVFYGATEPRTALSEVRPAVGSSVVIGSFEFVRPVRLLDLEGLRNIWEASSYFDPDYRDKTERINFLRGLSWRMARPVLPGDEQLEYLATQAVCEFLAGQDGFRLDGVVYPSVQGSGSGKNVVLFRRSSRVERIDVPLSGEVRCEFYDFGDPDSDGEFVVTEDFPDEDAGYHDAAGSSATLLGRPVVMSGCLVDIRPVTLRVDAHTLKVHEVTAVEVVSREFDVRRHRSGVDISDDFF